MAGEKLDPTPDHVSKSEPQSVVSGLDMRPTIDWYTANQAELVRRLPLAREEASPFTLLENSRFHITPGEVSALIGLFPERALKRSRLSTGAIIGKPSLYFANDATPEAITTTSDPTKALSPTAIIPSYTDNARWQQYGNPSSDVWLFEIPQDVPDGVRKIIHAEGLVHEVGHTVVTQALYTEGYMLRLPSGEVVSGFDFMIRFAQGAEQHDPVSHYSSFYRKSGEEFTSKLAIEEEFVETVTARLLGFAYSDNPEIRLNPLSDREELLPMIDDFLHAEEVTSA